MAGASDCWITEPLLTAVAVRMEENKKRNTIDLQELLKITKFTKQEIKMMYRGFKQECPNGTVNEDTFKEIYENFFPYGNATSYAHHVFKAFDVSSCGAISFKDMLVSLSTLLHGTLQEKIAWTFRVYDLNGDGVITKTEMGNVVVAVYELMGIVIKHPPAGAGCSLDYLPRRRDSVCVDINNMGVISPTAPEMEMSAIELRDNVENAFNRIDINRDGVLTREEFVQSCLRDPVISQTIANFQLNL